MTVFELARVHAGLVDTALPLPHLLRQLALVALVAQSAAAHAQSISPDPQGSGVIAGAVNWLTGTLLGNVATGLAILAIAILGILLAVGRLEWGRAALVVVGIFASLGRMDTIVDKMPFLAGFGVRLLLVIQGLAQLDRLYGAAARELILQNAGLQVYFAANDEQTSAYVSNRLGRRTIVQKTRSRSSSALGQTGTVTRGTSLHARPLLTPDEVRRLGADEAILFVEGVRPVRAKKIVHYRDKRFIVRLRVPIEVAPIEVPQHAPFVFQSTTTPVAAPAPPAAAPLAPTAAVIPTQPAAPPAATRRPRAKRVPAIDQLDLDRLLRGPEDLAGR